MNPLHPSIFVSSPAFKRSSLPPKTASRRDYLRRGLVIAAALLCTASLLPAENAEPGKIRIVLAGDSTVTDNAGWGKGFANCMAADVEVINRSKGGRSSKSFIAEGSWKKVLDLKPNYVLLQFGHNDQPGHGDRETEPQTLYRQYMIQYVDEARAAGIEPILVTSLSRRQWGKDGKIHSALQPWADAVKAVAEEKHVPLIDLHARSIEIYEQMGREKVLEISPLKNADPGSVNSDTTTPGTDKQVVDGTHLNEKGSGIFGPIIAQGLKTAVPKLASHIK